MDITFDVSALNIEEIEILEDVLGVPIDELGDGKGVKKGKLLRAIAYIEGRRKDPSFTLEDAGKVDPAGAAARLAPLAAASKDAKPVSRGSSRSPRRPASTSPTSSA